VSKRQWTRGPLAEEVPWRHVHHWRLLYRIEGPAYVAEQLRETMRVQLPRCVNCWRDMVLHEAPSGVRSWIHHHSRDAMCWIGTMGQVEPWKYQRWQHKATA
jgi:hypothetical protein